VRFPGTTIVNQSPQVAHKICVKSPDRFLCEMLPTVDALFPTSWAPSGLAQLRWILKISDHSWDQGTNAMIWTIERIWQWVFLQWLLASSDSSNSVTVIQSSLYAYYRTVYQLHVSNKLSRTREAYHQQHHVNLVSVHCG